MKQATKETTGVLGIGALACLACCAPLILTFLGGVTVAGLAGTLVVGTAALTVTAAGLVGLVMVMRRRRASACAVDPVQAVTLVARPGAERVEESV